MCTQCIVCLCKKPNMKKCNAETNLFFFKTYTVVYNILSFSPRKIMFTWRQCKMWRHRGMFVVGRQARGPAALAPGLQVNKHPSPAAVLSMEDSWGVRFFRFTDIEELRTLCICLNGGTVSINCCGTRCLFSLKCTLRSQLRIERCECVRNSPRLRFKYEKEMASVCAKRLKRRVWIANYFTHGFLLSR